MKPNKLGKYPVTWNADGTARVHGVPIFQVVSRAGRNYDRSWLVGAVNRFADERKTGFRPTIHVGHCRDEFDERPACGLLDALTVDGSRLLADFDRVQPETFDSLARGEWPYASVEAWYEKGKLKSLALLGSSPPQIKSEPLHVVREYESFREPDGALVDRFFVRAFPRDAARVVTRGVDIDLFQQTKEGLMAMHEDHNPDAGAPGGDAAVKIADLTTDDLIELIGQVVEDKLEEFAKEDEEEESAAAAGTPVGEAAPAAAFKEGAVPAEIQSVLDKMAERMDQANAELTKLRGETRAAKLNARFTELAAQGYTWQQPVADHFREVLAAQDEADWPATFEVMKAAGTRSAGRSPLDFAGVNPASQTAEQFAEQAKAAVAEAKPKDAKALADVYFRLLSGGEK